MGLCHSEGGANSETREQPGKRCPASDCLGAVTNLCQEIFKEKLDNAFSKGLRKGPSQASSGMLSFGNPKGSGKVPAEPSQASRGML